MGIKSRELARLAYDKELNGRKTIITKSEYKTLGESYEYIVHPDLFSSYQKALGFLKRKDIEDRMRIKVSKELKDKNTPIHRRLKDLCQMIKKINLKMDML